MLSDCFRWNPHCRCGVDSVVFTILAISGLLIGFCTSESELQDLAEALDLLPAPELKSLAKTFHLGSSGTQKQQLAEGLLRLGRQKSLFSVASSQTNIGTVILKR